MSLVSPAVQESVEDGGLAEELLEIAAGLTFEGEEAFRWMGRRHRAGRRKRRMDPGEGYPPVVADVGEMIYRYVYTRSVQLQLPRTAWTDRWLQRQFVDILDGANATEVSWMSGWRVVGQVGDELHLERSDGTSTTADVGRFDGLEDGSTGLLRGPPRLLDSDGGWYHARGRRDLTPGSGDHLRLYWNICVQGATTLLDEASRVFNAGDVPFRLKLLTDPRAYQRADAAVLWVDGGDWDRSRSMVRGLHEAVRSYLRPAAPLFTKRLDVGLGLAKNPDGGASFGHHRCRLVAQGLWEGFVRDLATPEDTLEAIWERFDDAGVPHDRPYVDDRSEPDYSLPAWSPDGTDFQGEVR